MIIRRQTRCVLQLRRMHLNSDLRYGDRRFFIPCIIIGFDAGRLKTLRYGFNLNGVLHLQHGCVCRHLAEKLQGSLCIRRGDLPYAASRTQKTSPFRRRFDLSKPSLQR